MNARQSQSSRQYQADAEEDGDDSEEESGDNLRFHLSQLDMSSIAYAEDS